MRYIMNRPAGPSWVLLVTSLPGRCAIARMRLWRALKGVGAAVLRDGVYLLPHDRSTLGALEEQAQQVCNAGGLAHVLKLNGLASQQEQVFLRLFDRSADYARLIEAIRAWHGRLGRRRRSAAQRELKRLRREYESLRATDYFPGSAAEQVGQRLREAEAALAAHLVPGGGEPRAAPGAPSAALTGGRTAAGPGRRARARPWIDRLASAWLIKRFIDPRARLFWLKDPRRCPKSAVGFDFDGAAFTHVGSRVTFEVLAASFGLEEDRALVRLGTLVHYLDVGARPCPRPKGLPGFWKGRADAVAATMRCSPRRCACSTISTPPTTKNEHTGQNEVDSGGIKASLIDSLLARSDRGCECNRVQRNDP